MALPPAPGHLGVSRLLTWALTLRAPPRVKPFPPHTLKPDGGGAWGPGPGRGLPATSRRFQPLPLPWEVPKVALFSTGLLLGPATRQPGGAGFWK